MAARDLPPLIALRAFEATARLSSFKAAAAELFVTPTAISHQIRQLEAHLGVRVLDRSPRSVTLTVEGGWLYQASVSGFAEISQALARIRNSQDPVVLTLSSTSAFLNQWIVPRLDELRELLPATDLRLHASDALVDLRSGGIEVAIRYGQGPFAGLDSVKLRDDVFAPVCSPRLRLSAPEDIRALPLIHIDGRQVPRPSPDWPRWCAEAGVSDVDTAVGTRFSDSALAVQAAVAGKGVAIVSLVLVANALSAGLLVAPIGPRLGGGAYHFAVAPDLGARADIVVLRDWFLQVMSQPSQLETVPSVLG